MNRQQEKRLNALEKKYRPKEKGLLLIAKDERESVQEAFDRSGNPGKREDYKILFVVGVSVKGL
jgi:hypothetical protein